MRKSIFVTLAVALGAAVTAFSQAGAPQQTPPAAAQAGSPAAGQPAVAAAQQQAAAAAQRQQLQQAIQSLQQRLRARYAADVPPEQLQQQIQQLQQQLQELGPAPAPGAFGGAGGRGGPPGAGFGAGRGGAGRGGPIVVPDDATPDQLRGFIQQLQQQNQQLNQRITAAQPPRTAPPPPYNCEPVNPNATPEARALLKKLCSVTGKGVLSGHHNFPDHRSLDSDAVFEATQKYPAIWGSDFGFLDGEDKDSMIHRDLMIEEAKKQYAAGSIIYLCWHMLRPTEDEPGKANPNGGTSESWGGSVQAKLTDEQWAELIASDSPLHQRWEKYMDTAAGYLKQLQDAHIPVIWRPMHENNGAFFWWGGRPGQWGTAQLYRELYNRMVNVHHLNNLLWVWNQNGPAPAGEFYNFFPGQKYVDIVSYDNYSTLDDRYYHEIQTIANGKPIALGEVGSIPSPAIFKAQPNWIWFMVWSGGNNSPGWNDPWTINRGDPIPTTAPTAPAAATSAPR
jgi:mannan endo-1,4-beta-mannosidase